MSKLIREARMGRPKSFKTGAVVGTYPKPLLYFGFDRGGIDVIPTKAALSNWPDGLIKPDCTYEDIVFVKPDGFGNHVVQEKITAVQFYEGVPMSLTADTKPTQTQVPFQQFISCYNQLTGKSELPWKTVVVDSLTGFTDVILNWISSFAPAMMTDARQWAGVAGGKVRQMTLSATSLPCHVVMLLHSQVDKNEHTGEITEQPSLYSQVLRDDFFGMFSQCFYSFKDSNGKPMLATSDKYPVKGIGPRWPLGLAKELQPDFNSIYGKELC